MMKLGANKGFVLDYASYFYLFLLLLLLLQRSYGLEFASVGGGDKWTREKTSGQ